MPSEEEVGAVRSPEVFDHYLQCIVLAFGGGRRQGVGVERGGPMPGAIE